jgi:hypothetical protein
MEATGNAKGSGQRRHQAVTLSAGGLEQNGTPVEIQELFLAAGEPSHIGNLHGVDSHPLERGTVGNRRDY